MAAIDYSKDVRLPLYKRLIIYSGNLMRFGADGLFNTSLNKSNQELVHAIEQTLLHNLYERPGAGNSIDGKDHINGFNIEFNDIPCFSFEDYTLEIPDIGHTSQRIDPSSRSNLDITAKLFFLSTSFTSPADNLELTPTRSAEFIKESLHYLSKQLGIDVFDTLIVAFDDITLDPDDNDYGDHPPKLTTRDEFALSASRGIFDLLQQYLDECKVKSVGVSDFSRAHLQYLLQNTSIRPKLNQISLQNCCLAPLGLIAYAQENNIELTTNGDCANMLSANTLDKILSKYHVNVVNGNSSHTSCPKVLPRWVLKYSVVIRDRGIVFDKGYIVGAERV